MNAQNTPTNHERSRGNNRHADQPSPFFDEVEKRRGKAAADLLRDDCRKEWAKRRDEMAGQR